MPPPITMTFFASISTVLIGSFRISPGYGARRNFQYALRWVLRLPLGRER